MEDIESRFHPSLLLSFWSLLAITDVQKIVTTNSGDLLSAVSLESLRRLQKKHYDTRSYKIDSSMLSYEDLRKIAFHVVAAAKPVQGIGINLCLAVLLCHA